VMGADRPLPTGLVSDVRPTLLDAAIVSD